MDFGRNDILLVLLAYRQMHIPECAVNFAVKVGLSGEIRRGQERGAVNDQGGVPALEPSDRDDLE